MSTAPLLLLGVGQVGLAVADACKGERKIKGTTREPLRVFELFLGGLEPIVMPWPSAEVIASVAQSADVVVSFPPDGSTDAVLAPGCLNARRIVYISSTGVYGKREGTIDDTTPVDEDDENAKLRIEAEKIWRSIGATVIRAPGIYSAGSGLHRRLRDPNFRLPVDTTRIASRIHVNDLASFILAALQSKKQQETYVVGDLKPASHADVSGWLCKQMGMPLPPSAPLNELHHTQRSNRAIDPSRALKELDVSLKYPTYKQGYEAILSESTEESA